MELRHLRYFLATAEELHFTRAAARLNINQPPLSQQIKDLENELQVQLFHRIGRRIELTEAGQGFLTDTRAVLELVERAKTSAQKIARGEKGLLRIGFTSSACCHPMVPSVINDFRASHPDVELALSEGPTTYLAERLGAGHIDVAFLRPGSTEHPGLHYQILVREELLVALPAQHALAERQSIQLRELTGESFVLPPRSAEPLSHDALLTGCHGAGFRPSILREVPQAASIINMVATGYGVALIPRSMCQLKPPGVVYVPVDGPAPKVSLSIGWREANRSAAVEHFISMVGHASRSATKKSKTISD
jgi:DNA-binding transcriptional LysR family regulator